MDTIPDHREELRKNHNKNDVVARWVFGVHGNNFFYNPMNVIRVC